MRTLTAEARELRRIYKRKYRQQNKEKINKQQREWRARNPDKIKAYQTRYWLKKAAENALGEQGETEI